MSSIKKTLALFRHKDRGDLEKTVKAHDRSPAAKSSLRKKTHALLRPKDRP